MSHNTPNKPDTGSNQRAYEFSSRDLNATWDDKKKAFMPRPKPFRLTQDPEFKPDYTMGVFGSRGTGKSWLIRWLIANIRHYYVCVYIFTKTKCNKWYGTFCNPEYIYDVNEMGIHGALEVLQRIMEDQDKKVAAWRKGCRINPYVLIVYDDCIDVATKYNQDFLDMFYLGRHKKVS